MASNGMMKFSLHSTNAAETQPVIELNNDVQRTTNRAFAEVLPFSAVDAETAAKRYLNGALESTALPTFTAPTVNNTDSEFKSLGTETLPLTGTTTVKFRQNINKIPVYGSLVTVELDNNNELIGIDSALGIPANVNPIATLSPSDAVNIVQKHEGFVKELAGITPRLSYFYDEAEEKWRLVFVLEDVPVSQPVSRQPTPTVMDYFVDAHTGDVVAEYPRTPTVSTLISGQDNFGMVRQFNVETDGAINVLYDATLNVQTFDFGFRDPVRQERDLPGIPISSTQMFPPSAVSAHANACEVSRFLRQTLKRPNIDNLGGRMTSSINCVDNRSSPDGRQWENAFWNGTQMVYGQRIEGGDMLSMAAALDVVAHEMFHGVTDSSARLIYAKQSGALNESYSDIFGIIIKNWQNPDATHWDWTLGQGLSASRSPFRDLSSPSKYGQPERMADYTDSPVTFNGDYGGVHKNSGIHNKATYLILYNGSATSLLNPIHIAIILYLALTQRLSRTSEFSDSKAAVLSSARTLYRNDAPSILDAKLKVITDAFDTVGIH